MCFVLTDNGVRFPVSPPKLQKVTFQLDPKVEPSSKSSPVGKVSRPGELNHRTNISYSFLPTVAYENYIVFVLRCNVIFSLIHIGCVVRGKVKLCSPVKQVEEGNRPIDKTSDPTVDGPSVSLVSSPVSRSPAKGELILHTFLNLLDSTFITS